MVPFDEQQRVFICIESEISSSHADRFRILHMSAAHLRDRADLSSIRGIATVPD